MKRTSKKNSDPLSYVAAALLGATALFGVYFFAFAPTYLRVAAPAAGSELYEYLNALALVLERDRSSVRLQVVPHESDAEIARAVEAERVDLATVRADGPLPPSTLAVVELEKLVSLILARPGAGIEKVADLRGRRVAELTRDTPGASAFSHVLAPHRLGSRDIDLIAIDSLDAIGATFSEKRLDALLVTLPRASLAATELIKALATAVGKPPVMLPIPEAKAIAAGNATFASIEVKAGELAPAPVFPEATIETLSFPELLVVCRKLSAAAVQELTKQIFITRQALAVSHPVAGRIAALSTKRGGSFGVHPGAAVYYDATETSFLDRHSSIIWLLLFGFSTLVSALLWLRRRLFPQQLETLRANHAELLELIETVRTSDDPAVFDMAERRIDEIVADLSQLVFDGDIDASQQPAFDLVIARIEKIIAARRGAVASVAAH
jgi:TRAP-type uncharacterized transport system substrate-binding protein